MTSLQFQNGRRPPSLILEKPYLRPGIWDLAQTLLVGTKQHPELDHVTKNAI